MKVLLWFQGWPCQFQHAVAVTLKKRYGVNDFSAIAIGRRSYNFLKTQRDVKYNPIALVQDVFLGSKNLKIDREYLSSLEKKYGIPTLWMYPLADKDLLRYNRFAYYTHEDLMKIVQGCFKFTIEFLEKVKPEFILMPLAESMELLVLHEVARHMKIPTLMIGAPRIGNRISIYRSTYDDEWYESVYEIYDKMMKSGKCKREKEAIAYIREFRKRPLIYGDYKRTFTGKQEFYRSIWRTPVKTLRRALGYFNRYYFGDLKDDYMFKNKSPIRLAMAELEVRIRRATLRRSRIFEKPNYKEQYVYYTLPYEPEITTMLWAPFYLDQISLIENIAKSLPMSFKLYVKEHPTMLGNRPASYYRQLSKIPNVRLIDPSTSSYEITKNARLVVTITGTVGLEALMLKKPVITFGRPFYNKLDMVKKAGSMHSLPALIRDALENYKHDEKQLVKLLAIYFENSFNTNYGGVGNQESIEKVIAHPDFGTIMDAFAEEMGLKPRSS